MPITLTVYSAACALAAFWHEYHREPIMSECTNQNALPHYTTLCRMFHSYSAAMSALHILVCSANSTAVATLDNGVALKAPYKKCLGCERQIKNVGAHVRHCRFCRYKMFHEETSTYQEAYPIPRQWYISSWDLTDDLDDFDFDV